MSDPVAGGVTLLGYLLMLLGLIGAVLPLLPGSLFIWLGVFVWAWADGFNRIGWPILLLLGILVIVTWTSDIVLSTLSSRKVGATWKTVAAAIVGGLIGGIALSTVLPVVGTMAGAALGAFVGVVLLELLQQRPWRQAARVGIRYCLGSLTATLLNVTLCLVMLAIFAWQAFL